jgi:hypothetical protein
LSVSITAPSAGYLVINASIRLVEAGGLNDEVACRLQVGDSTAVGSERVLIVPAWSKSICATTATAKVASGARSVDLNLSGVGTADLYDASMSVIFIPFGADGSVPSS